MWVLSSPPDVPGVRALKPPKTAGGNNEQGEAAPSIWVRPDKKYEAGRSDVYDLYLSHPRLSRSSCIFALAASKANATLFTEGGRPTGPSYSLTITAGSQSLSVTAGPDAGTIIASGQEYVVQDGTQINTWPDRAKECLITFDWKPVHLYRPVKKKELETLQANLATIGVTFSNGSGGYLPDTSHTHCVLSKMSGSQPGFVSLVAANCQVSIVGTAWLDALLQAAKVPEVTKKAEEPPKNKADEKSRLELDFNQNWPPEDQYLPLIDGRDAEAADYERWKPNPARQRLLEGIAFIDCITDPNLPVLVATAGGTTVKACIESLAEFQDSVSQAPRQAKKYIIIPGENQEPLPEKQMQVVRQSHHIVDGYTTMKAIYGAVEHTSALSGVIATLPDVQPVPGDGPLASVPGATADISFPATHPDDVAASAPKRPVPVPNAQALQAAAAGLVEGEGQPRDTGKVAGVSKRPRKLADRAPIDPFANLFAEAGSSTNNNVVEMQTTSDTQSSSIGSRRSALDKDSEIQSQSRFSKPDSKYAKLKRRVGQAGSSQLGVLPEADSVVDDEDDRPAKKIKSFDPDIMSATSQVDAKFREKAQERAKEPVVEISVGAGGSKRKAAQVQPDTDEEPAKEATQSTSRKKPVLAVSKKGKAKESQDSTQPPAQSNFFQINTGRRKVGKADAEFNEDFNKLHLRKPSSHKMGWNERDVFEEEMAEKGPWEPDDNATFFQIQYINMTRDRNAKKRVVGAVQPLANGQPNFKAFRPKSATAAADAQTAARSRNNISLVVYEAPGYGLRESYREGSKRPHGSDSEESVIMPMGDTAPSQPKGKGKAKATAAAKRSQRIAKPKAKRPVVSESSEEEERTSTAKEDSAPGKTARRTAGKESITIDSSSDDEDGKTFRGFGTASRATGRRR